MRDLSKPHQVVGPLCVAAALVAGAAGAATAQLPGSPVLQNAWVAPGLSIGADFGVGSGTSNSGGSVFSAVVGWAPLDARFQLTGAAGLQGQSDARAVFSVRLAVPITRASTRRFELAAFIGLGAGSQAFDTLLATSIIPVGLAIGYHAAIGANGRSLSLYADPNYQYQTGVRNRGTPRLGLGFDLGITSRVGVTVGLETGPTAPYTAVGPHATLFRVGLTLAAAKRNP